MSVSTPRPSGSTAHRPEYVGVGGLRADPQVAGADWWPILVGTLGSLLLVVGSYSVGWLASASPINRWQWLIPYAPRRPACSPARCSSPSAAG